MIMPVNPDPATGPQPVTPDPEMQPSGTVLARFIELDAHLQRATEDLAIASHILDDLAHTFGYKRELPKRRP